MKYKVQRDSEPINVTRITIYIGEERFIITESVDRKLNIVKYSDGYSDLLKVHPRSGNEIELS